LARGVVGIVHMGTSFIQGRTRLRISHEKEDAALNALQDSTVDFPGGVREAITLDEALEALGWAVQRRNGSISGIVSKDRKLRHGIEMLDTLAPFVRRGSSIVLMLDTEEAPAIHWFDGERRNEEKIRRDDPNFDQLMEAPEGAEVHSEDGPRPLTWDDLRGKMPAKPKLYRPTETFSEGEWISHPKLGAGYVAAVVEKSKVRILFEGGEKLLAQGMAP